MTKTRHCRPCKADRPCELWRNIKQNGAEDFFWKCTVCDRLVQGKGGGLFIKKEEVLRWLTFEEIEQLPVKMPEASNRCVKCGNRQCELHHWLPEAMSAEFDSWPKDYLCDTCHKRWHAIVTPQLVK